MIYVACPSCKKIIKAHHEKTGEKTTCICGEQFLIPHQQQRAADQRRLNSILPIKKQEEVANVSSGPQPQAMSMGPSKARLLALSLSIVGSLVLVVILVSVIAAANHDQLQFISDMDEFDVKVYRKFAKHGFLGFRAGDSDQITVDGKRYPNGLSTHALTKAVASVSYDLGGKYKTFMTAVALNDSAGGDVGSRVTFIVLGDDKILWISKKVNSAREVQECKASVVGVKVLKLQVDCAGDNRNAQAVWLDPKLVLK